MFTAETSQSTGWDNGFLLPIGIAVVCIILFVVSEMDIDFDLRGILMGCFALLLIISLVLFFTTGSVFLLTLAGILLLFSAAWAFLSG